MLWRVLKSFGVVKTTGGFYFLVPIPTDVLSEEEIIDVIAMKFGVLLMSGSVFGATGYLRLSYGSIPPVQSLAAIEKLRSGLEYIQNVANSK